MGDGLPARRHRGRCSAALRCGRVCGGRSDLDAAGFGVSGSLHSGAAGRADSGSPKLSDGFDATVADAALEGAVVGDGGAIETGLVDASTDGPGGEGAPGDAPTTEAEGGTPCSRTSDCGPGGVCGFPVSAGCSARGVCVYDRVFCNDTLVEPACGCSGTSFAIGCTWGALGYTSEPLLHWGDCDGGPVTLAPAPDACTPKTCADFPAGTCGVQADGCGGLTTDCRTCVAPEYCGGGGPALCGGCNTLNLGACQEARLRLR